MRPQRYQDHQFQHFHLVLLETESWICFFFFFCCLFSNHYCSQPRLPDSSLGFKTNNLAANGCNMQSLNTNLNIQTDSFHACLSDIDHLINNGCPLESSLSCLRSAQLPTSLKGTHSQILINGSHAIAPGTGLFS